MDQNEIAEQTFFVKLAEIILNKVDEQKYGFRAVILKEGHFNGRVLKKETMFKQYAFDYFRLILNLAEGLGPEEFTAMWTSMGEHIIKTAYSKDLKYINENHNKNKNKNN